jgi:exodeoxyribonuclease VII large subunit
MQSSPLSVTELNEYVRRTLAGDPMLQGIDLRGEVSNFKRHTSGHLYFSLKDENSRIACVMFRQHAQLLRFQPQDGLRVVLSGSVGLYSAAGSYQFYGEMMRADGRGSLYEQFLKVKEMLQKEGLFDAALKKPLPLMPRAIGIVTSGGGAVLHDIITVTRRRFPAMQLILRDSLVQGDGAADDLVRGLTELAALEEVDVIIIGRGGGSLEDLWAFNEERLVRAVTACIKPVISAVGHETDITLTDFAADVRAATPSAAAELAVPSREEMKNRLRRQQETMTELARQRIEQKRIALSEIISRLSMTDPTHRLNLALSRQKMLKERLQVSVQSMFDLILSDTQGLIERFKLSGPWQTLQRGYVIALDRGRPIKSAKETADEMQLQFYDGVVRVKTIGVQLNTGEGIHG